MCIDFSLVSLLRYTYQSIFIWAGFFDMATDVVIPQNRNPSTKDDHVEKEYMTA